MALKSVKIPRKGDLIQNVVLTVVGLSGNFLFVTGLEKHLLYTSVVMFFSAMSLLYRFLTGFKAENGKIKIRGYTWPYFKYTLNFYNGPIENITHASYISSPGFSLGSALCFFHIDGKKYHVDLPLFSLFAPKYVRNLKSELNAAGIEIK